MIQKVLVQRLGVHKHHVFNSMDILISFLMEKSIRRNLSAHNKRTNQQKTYDKLEKRTNLFYVLRGKRRDIPSIYLVRLLI